MFDLFDSTCKISLWKVFQSYQLISFCIKCTVYLPKISTTTRKSPKIHIYIYIYTAYILTIICLQFLQPSGQNKMLALYIPAKHVTFVSFVRLTSTLALHQLTFFVGSGEVDGGMSPGREGCQARNHWPTNKPAHFSDRRDIFQPSLWHRKRIF